MAQVQAQPSNPTKDGNGCRTLEITGMLPNWKQRVVAPSAVDRKSDLVRKGSPENVGFFHYRRIE